MIKIARYPKSTLHYRQFLSLILEHFKVPLKGEEFVEIPKHDIFDFTSIRRIRYKRTNKGRWVQKTMTSEASSKTLELVNRSEDDKELPIDNITMTSLKHQIDETRIKIYAKFSGHKHFIATMNTRQEAMQIDIAEIL